MSLPLDSITTLSATWVGFGLTLKYWARLKRLNVLTHWSSVSLTERKSLLNHDTTITNDSHVNEVLDETVKNAQAVFKLHPIS